MNSGKQDARPPALPDESIPEAYLQCARWLLQQPQVLEVWSIVSDLPEIATPDSSVTLDAGTWFLFRVQLPPVPDGESIISFVRQIKR